MAEWVLVLTLYPRDMGSIPTHSTKGSEGCISGDRISVLGVVQIPNKAVGPIYIWQKSQRQHGLCQVSSGDRLQIEEDTNTHH